MLGFLKWFRQSPHPEHRPSPELVARAEHWFRETRFKLRSGRAVRIQQIYIQLSLLGFLERNPERIRNIILQELPQRARKAVPSWGGIVIRDPPPGPLPLFTVFVDLESEPVRSRSHCSSLVVVWFTDTFPRNLYDHIKSQIEGVDWDQYAKDGDY